MKTVDLILLGILVIIVASSVFVIYHSKKKGRKCIGCPDSSNCSGCCNGCKNT